MNKTTSEHFLKYFPDEDISNFDTANVSDMGFMFLGCIVI